MPYIRTEEVKAIREALKANQKLKKFKFSVRREHYSSVKIVVVSGPDVGVSGKENVNKFWYKTNYADNPKLLNLIAEIEKTVQDSHPCYTVSEDGDYGSIPNYYWDVSVGNWDKPYQVKQ